MRRATLKLHSDPSYSWLGCLVLSGVLPLSAVAQPLFSDVTDTHLPVLDDETREIRADDVDGDGDPDLVVANVSFLRQVPAEDQLLLNDGSGRFTVAEPGRFPGDPRSNFTIQLADLDHDGDLDVLAPATVFATSTAEMLVHYVDTAGGAFVAKGTGFDIADRDGDGMMDLLLEGEAGTLELLYRDGRLQLPADAVAWPQAESGRPVDIDQDGSSDIAVVRLAPTLLADSTTPGLPPELQFVDLAQDGGIDVAIVVTRQMASIGDTQVLLNDGRGQFTAALPGTILPADADGNGFDIEVADFDGDGIDDLFLCQRASVAVPEAAVASGGMQRLLLGQPE